MKTVKCAKCGAEYRGTQCPGCGEPAPAQVKQKKKFKWWYILVGIAIIGIIGSFGDKDKAEPSDSTDGAPQVSDTQTPNTPANTTPSQPTEPAAPTEPQTISYDAELGNGYFTAGIDFPGGTYDIVATSGGGNVISSNAYDGGINAIMGTDTSSDMYQQEYQNIKLPNGTVLSIDGLSVKITSDDADGTPLEARSQSITETVKLGNGNFTAGKDFTAGIYDIVAVSGGGNVISSNSYDGGINAIMGTDTSSDMYKQEYKNIALTDGVELSIDGLSVELRPSK